MQVIPLLALPIAAGAAGAADDDGAAGAVSAACYADSASAACGAGAAAAAGAHGAAGEAGAPCGGVVGAANGACVVDAASVAGNADDPNGRMGFRIQTTEQMLTSELRAQTTPNKSSKSLQDTQGTEENTKIPSTWEPQ